jgi:hypothetical protein
MACRPPLLMTPVLELVDCRAEQALDVGPGGVIVRDLLPDSVDTLPNS